MRPATFYCTGEIKITNTFHCFLLFILQSFIVNTWLQLYQQTWHVISRFSWHDSCIHSCSIKDPPSWTELGADRHTDPVLIQLVFGRARGEKAMYVTYTHTHRHTRMPLPPLSLLTSDLLSSYAWVVITYQDKEVICLCVRESDGARETLRTIQTKEKWHPVFIYLITVSCLL